MIQQLKDTCEVGENIEPDVLIEAALTEYNNMVKQKIEIKRTLKKQKT